MRHCKLISSRKCSCYRSRASDSDDSQKLSPGGLDGSHLCRQWETTFIHLRVLCVVRVFHFRLDPHPSSYTIVHGFGNPGRKVPGLGSARVSTVLNWCSKPLPFRRVPASAEQHQTRVSTAVHSGSDAKTSPWQQWLEHPERARIHWPIYYLHLWVGLLAGAYIFLMSVTGSFIVFRNQLEANSGSHLVPVVEWLVNLHDNLLSGMTGQAVNGIGGVSMILLCITGLMLWWPGIMHWKRGLTLDWAGSSARVNWDLHNVLGFWFFLFVLLWGVSSVYFVFPRPFNAVVDFLQPIDSTTRLRFGDVVLLWLSNLHFGRFNWFTEILWSALGLVPAVLSLTGAFMCGHRIFVRKGGPLTR